MADVRALLRSERVSRRLAHPHAAYSSSGQLMCSICRVPVKSETLWDAHLQSTKHAAALREVERLEREASRGSKKRKAAADDEAGDRKKFKNEGLMEDQLPGGVRKIATARSSTRVDDSSGNVRGEPAGEDEQVEKQITGGFGPATITNTSAKESQDAIDEREWAAFERDVATPPPEPQALSAFMAPASIQAQPLTAAELSAQSKKLQGSQRDRREAETAAEKEEASRQLEDEFEEMEALELRVRKLRDQREALRLARMDPIMVEPAPTNAAVPNLLVNDGAQGQIALYFDDEESEDDDPDDWGFGHP